MAGTVSAIGAMLTGAVALIAVCGRMLIVTDAAVAFGLRMVRYSSFVSWTAPEAK
jgi:hypothetical protein